MGAVEEHDLEFYRAMAREEDRAILEDDMRRLEGLASLRDLRCAGFGVELNRKIEAGPEPRQSGVVRPRAFPPQGHHDQALELLWHHQHWSRNSQKKWN